MNSEIKLILDWILDALSQVKCPDKSEISVADLHLKLNRIFYGCTLVGEVFEYMQRQVSDRSMGLVVLEKVEIENFPMMPVKGPAVYLKLINYANNKEQFLMFGPYGQPVKFVSKDGQII